jgi:ABC-type transport system involved in multi-copper enzyme maturation permease subunit
MSTATLTPDVPSPAAPAVRHRTEPARFSNLLTSEWTKFRSVRSTYWTMIAAMVATVALGVIICVQYVVRYNHLGPKEHADLDPTQFSLNGLYLAQIAVGALGVLVISSEYGTGMIRTSLAAVPRRRALLAAKGAVFGAAALVCGELLSFAAFGLGQAILGTKHAGASLADPEVLRAVVGGGLYLTVVGLLAFGLGALIRHTAGALSAFFGVLFAGSVIVELLPSSWRHALIEYMPANAGSQIFTVKHTADSLSPWAGFAVFCAYAAAALVAAFVLVTRRDA